VSRVHVFFFHTWQRILSTEFRETLEGKNSFNLPKEVRKVVKIMKESSFSF